MTAKRQSPAGTPGKEKNTETQADFTAFLRSAQQCYPCTSCAYLRLVPQQSGGFKRVCSFLGDHIGKAGRPLCEFHKGGGA